MAAYYFPWNDLLPKGNRMRTRRQLFRKVLDDLEEKHPDLVHGETNCTLTEEEVDLIIDSLMKNSPGHSFYYKISFFRQGIELGRRKLGWKVPVPQLPIVASRERNKFTPEGFKLLSRGRAVECAFLDDLVNSHANSDLRVGQLLMSAILYGGFTVEKWLDPWLISLNDKNRDPRARWFDIVLIQTKTRNKKNYTHEIPRRWFPDALTRALLMRDPSSEWPADINASRALAVYLKYLGQNDITVKELLKFAKTALGFKIKSFLSSYANGQTLSASLPKRVLARLSSGQALVPFDGESVDDVASFEFAEFSQGQKKRPGIQKKLFDKFLKEVLPKNEINAKKALENLKIFNANHESQLSQAFRGLMAWVEDLLTAQKTEDMVRGRKKKDLRVSTAHTYITTIGRRLLSATETDRPFFTLQSEDLQSIYERVTTSNRSTKKQKYKIGMTLNRFHNFLVDRYKVQAVDLSHYIPDSTPAVLNVNANLVSPEEFDRVQKVLAIDFRKASHLRKIQYLIAALGFYCGLRHTEALKIGLADILGTSDPYLIIRNNRYAKTKSEASQRLIPLRLLLPPHILTYLLEMRDARIKKTKHVTKNTLLFCLPGQSAYLLSGKIFLPITQALHQVTGDHTLHFHHLRHSFATWLTLRLLYNFSDETRSRVHFLKHEIFGIDHCAELRQVILGSNQYGRQAIYAVASLCGHVSPKTTLLHYIHLCDWLLTHELAIKENEPPLPAKVIIKLLGLTKSKFYDRGGASKGLSGLLRDRDDKVPGDYGCALVQPDLEPIPDINPPTVFFEQVHIYLVNLHKLASNKIRTTKPERIETAARSPIYKELKSLSDMKSIKGYFRHIDSHITKKYPDDPILGFLKPLYLIQDKILAEQINFRVNRILANEDKFVWLKDNVRYFTNHYAVNAKGTHFLDFQKLNDFLIFVRHIGINTEQIRIHIGLPPAENSDDSLLTEQLHVDHNIPRKNFTCGPAHLPGSIWVQIVNEDSKGVAQKYGSYGFRFAMYMMEIYFRAGDLGKTN